MNSPHHEQPCDGLILSGGRGTRVGGRDKGLMSINGVTGVQQAVDLLRPMCRALYVSANRNLEQYAAIRDVIVLRDLRSGFPGPLAALEAAADMPLSPLLLIVPNDMPGLSPEVPVQLLAQLRDSEGAVDMVYASDGVREQYLCACVRSRCLQNAGDLLDRGEHRVRKWIATLRSEVLVVEHLEQAGLVNKNRAEDWDSSP